MSRERPAERGFTIVELTVTLVVFMIVAISFFGLYTSLVRSTIVAKRQAVATTLATNQMEYLKSLPYDSLAVSGGSIYSANPIPAVATQTLNGVKYTIRTSINYVDDAYDGCANYPTTALKQQYCRNYPPPSGSPSVDTNPQDYKVVHVTVTDPTTSKLAQVDTQISARVSETASSTGALFVNVIDNNGNKLSGATVSVKNTTVTPVVNVSDTTDVNGVAILYGLPPDSATDFVITATLDGYSGLTTINASGSLQPTYPNQKILSQQSSYVTLTLKQQGTNSLVAEAVDTAGTPISGVQVYVKGGYKNYTSTSDTSYYYDNMSGSDSRPATDTSGLFALQNLVPGAYVFCGDTGATGCKKGSTTYYLAAAVPYGGANPFNPVNVPTYDPANPPTTTYPYGADSYLQKVRLILTTSTTFPRVYSINPGSVSLASGTANATTFTVQGANLPCSSTASSCGTKVSFKQGASTYNASCTGTSGTQLSCSVNLAAAAVGNTQMVVVANGSTLTMPASPMIGGIIVTP